MSIVHNVGSSEIRLMALECARRDGMNLAIGIGEKLPPSQFLDAAHVAVSQDYNGYAPVRGLEELRRQIGIQLSRFTDIVYNHETEIAITSGATGAFYSACVALLRSGDEVVMFAPYYPYHRSTLLSLGVKPCQVVLRTGSWTFQERELRAAIHDRTRAIVINTPANPCGKVFTREELELIYGIARDANLWIITDEVYQHFVFGSARHVSPASLPGARDHTITIGSLSKTFSVTGWRLGFVAASKGVLDKIADVHDMVYACAPSPLQRAAAIGMSGMSDDFYSGLGQRCEAKRDRLCAALVEARLSPFVPSGGFYVMADIGRIAGMNCREKVMNLLSETSIAVVSGASFYDSLEDSSLVRACFAIEDDILERACTALIGMK